MRTQRRSLETVKVAAALRLLQPGGRIIASPGCGSPTTLLAALNEAPHRRDPYTIYSGLQLTYPFLCALNDGRVRHVSWHVMPEIRDLVQSGVVEYLPTRASEVPSHIDRWMIDTAFVRISPPDHNGNVSLGPCGSYPIEAVRRCKRVIAEVDEQVPNTHGNRFPRSLITIAVESSLPMPRYESATPSPEARSIAETVVKLIPNGATMQVGIGAIPESIVEILADSDIGDLRFIGMGTDSMTKIAERETGNGIRCCNHCRRAHGWPHDHGFRSREFSRSGREFPRRSGRQQFVGVSLTPFDQFGDRNRSIRTDQRGICRFQGDEWSRRKCRFRGICVSVERRSENHRAGLDGEGWVDLEHRFFVQSR